MAHLSRSLVIALIVTGMAAGTAAGLEWTYWTGEPGTVGDWFDASHWTHGVPKDEYFAFVANGGTAEIASGDAVAGSLFLGAYDPAGVQCGGSGSVVQSGGTAKLTWSLHLGAYAYTKGSYELTGGTLASRYAGIGTAGTGYFSQSGGEHTVAGALNIGGPGCAWILPIEPPEPEPNQVLARQRTRSKTQDAPRARIHVYPRPPVRPEGIYELTGGTLSAGSLSLRGGGRFTQVGGTTTVARRLTVGAWPWHALSTDTRPVRAVVELIGGEMLTQGTSVGAAGLGLFSQTGGVHTVDGTLRVGAGWPWPIVRPLPDDPDQAEPVEALGEAAAAAMCPDWTRLSRGRYELSGGEVSATDTIVAGAGRAEFIQTGGTHAVERTLRVGGPGHPWAVPVPLENGGPGPGPDDPTLLCPPRPVATHGYYELSGGDLTTGATHVGGYGRAQFVQSGGTHTVAGALRVGGPCHPWRLQPDPYPVGPGPIIYEAEDLTAIEAEAANVLPPWPVRAAGRYELQGGTLSTQTTTVGGSGYGVFVQSGGAHAVAETLYLGGPSYWWPCRAVADVECAPQTAEQRRTGRPDDRRPRPVYAGRYELAGGELSARQELIRWRGTMKQTGGTNAVEYLSVGAGGRYGYLGGSLEIAAGLDLNGVLDFGGADTALAIDSGLLSFGRGQLLDSNNAAITAGKRSLIIFPTGFDPETQLAEFHSAGLVHFAGEVISLTADEGFVGWGTIYDHVESKGQILAYEGGRIDLRRGLFVHEGSVDLGSGRLNVTDGRSGITSGRLAAASMTVGYAALTPMVWSDVEDVGGVFRQGGGSVALSGALVVGHGTYELGDGELSARGLCIGGRLCGPGDSSFVQHGGTCKIDGDVWVGGPAIVPVRSGRCEVVPLTELSAEQLPDLSCAGIFARDATYELHAGRLSANNLNVVGSGLSPVLGRARFINSCGINELAGALTLSGGSYELHCRGVLGANSVDIGGAGPGNNHSTLIQTDGVCRIQEELRVGKTAWMQLPAAGPAQTDPTGPGPQEPAGNQPGPMSLPSTATYDMSGGYLTAQTLILDGLASRARFDQTGGRVELRRALAVAAGDARYDISAGSLTVPTLAVGSPLPSPTNVQPTLAIGGPAAEISIRHRLSFGSDARFEAAPDSAVHFTGPNAAEAADPDTRRSAFENFSVTPSALAGLNDLRLIFEGGRETVATLEVASEDMGHGPAGYVENFALDVLQLGSEADVGWVDLVDLFDNQPEQAEPDVLYVKTLIIGPGSFLDLNGLTIYYQHAYIDPNGGIEGVLTGGFEDGLGEFTQPGRLAAMVPEPMTISIVALGAVVLLRRKRRS